MDAEAKRRLEAKISAGERLDADDAAELYGCDELAWLGRLAHDRRTATYGERATFRVDAEPADQATVPIEYGPAGLVDRLLRVRDRQDAAGDVRCVVPVPRDAEVRHEPATEVASPAEDPSPAAALRAFALARLVLDNVDHVGCVPAVLGGSLAQLALTFGADDLGGPLADGTDRDDVLHLIWDAGCTPVERDASFAVVREYEPAPTFADRRSVPQDIWT